ncbi:MAG: methyltransferase domain-containing protein [Bacteroidota bacterium]
MASYSDTLHARVEREREAHTDHDILGESVQLKNRFSHIWTYPGVVRLRATLEDALCEATTSRVLDYGCGLGERSLTALKHGAEVDGIDISTIYIEKANAAARDAGYPGDRFRFVVGDAHVLPYPEATFDLVIGEGIVHHLDIDTALAEVHRVLKPGGRAVFLEPLLDNPFLKLFRYLTPQARTEDELPLSARDLHRIATSDRWRVESTYSGLLAAPVAVGTSVIIPSRPGNVLLRAADRAERALQRRGWLTAWNQYVLLNLIRTEAE